MAGFADQIDQWAMETQGRMRELTKRAIELFADELRKGRHNGGLTPWVTGNLVRSILAEINGVVAVKPEGDDGEGNFAEKKGQVEAQAALMGPDDVLYIGFQAIYAARVNYGFVGEDSLGRSYNQEGAHFIEAAVLAWPNCVRLAAEELFGMANR